MSKTLLQRLRDSGLIKTEERKIQREREKVGGYMWGGKLKITLKDDRLFVFKLWQKIYGDIGTTDWEPKDEDLHFYPEYISIDGKLKNYRSHVIIVDNKYYGIKSRFPLCHGNKEIKEKIKEIEEKIKNDSWKDDSDIHFII